MDKLSNIEALVNIQQLGSFTAAARKLNISNSVISKRIKDLEADLEVELFIRSTRSVSLTESGRTYYNFAEEFLDELKSTEASLKYRSSKPTGTLTIAAPISFGQQRLAALFLAYQKKYTEVKLELHLSDSFVNLQEGRFDVALRIGKLEDSSLIAKKLSESRKVVCASKAYFKKHPKPQTPKDLLQHNCLSYLNVADGKSWSFVYKKKKLLQKIHGDFKTNNGELLLEAALAGRGITALPTFIVGEALQRGLLETVLDDYEDELRNIYAVYIPSKHIPAKVRTFVDFLSEKFSL